MKFYLSVFLSYGDFLNTRMDLLEFNSIYELDDYTRNFNNSKEIKELFQIDISEFLLECRYNKAYKESKSCLPIIRLCAYTYYENNLRFLPLIFKNEEIIEDIDSLYLVLEDDCIFNKFLRDYDYLIGYSKEITNLKRQYYLGSIGVKMKLINIFINKILVLEENKKHFYLRTLMNVCNLKFKNEENTINHFQIEDCFEECDDEYFKRLINDEKYDELFNTYSLEKILLYSSKNNPLGIRRN